MEVICYLFDVGAAVHPCITGLNPSCGQDFQRPFVGGQLPCFYIAVTITPFNVNRDVGNGCNPGEISFLALVAVCCIILLCRDKLMVKVIGQVFIIGV